MNEKGKIYFIFRLFVLLLVARSFTEGIQSAEGRTSVNDLPPSVCVQSANEALLSEIKEYHVFNARAADTYVKVLFSATTTVKNFKVLKLSDCEIDDNGKITFHEETLYTQPEFVPGCPIVVIMNFFGSIPNNGISYTDKYSTTHKFTVNLNGMDNKVEIEEY